jgi:ligand-binding sensor domain-containing protein
LDVQSASFRLVWALVTITLLVALVWVIRLAWLSNPTSQPRLAARPTSKATLMQTPPRISQPTSTSLPVATPTVALGNTQRMTIGGFTFRPLLGYAVEITGGSVKLQPEVNRAAADTFFILDGRPTAQFVATTSNRLEAIFQVYAATYAQAYDVQVGAPVTTTINQRPAYTAALQRKEQPQQTIGRIVLAEPLDEQIFVLAGVTAADQWRAIAQYQFEALLASVRFMPAAVVEQAPAVTLATPQPQRTTVPTRAATVGAAAVVPTSSILRTQTSSGSHWTSYTNANMANAVTASINTMWVATDGGAVAWNKSNNTLVKYTTPNGLAANRTTTVENCPLRGLGIVFGSELGLQIFDSQTNAWKVLNSANSGMSFDDVSALYCDVEHRYLVVGYQQHGLDIFDADRGSWRYLGQAEGLQNNFVEAVTVVGDRNEIWVASGFGLSVIPKAGETAFYDDNNSALETNQIKRMVVDAAGVVWLGAQNALYKVDGDEWTVYDQRAVLASRFPSGAINGLAVADDGSLWLGSSTGEICHFDPVRVQCQAFLAGEDGMVAGELTSLAIGSNGAIYYTTLGGGVSMYDGTRWRAFIVPNETLLGNQIHALAQDSDGALWIATEAGLQRTNPANGAVLRQFTQDNTDLSSLESEVLHAAADGGIWFGALGASYFNGFSWKSYAVADGLAGTLIRAIAIDGQGRTWFGTESGLSIWNGSTFFNLTRENGLPSDNISALLAADDIVWISAVGGGLFRFERNQLQLFNTQNSRLPSDSITVIAQDADGALLIGHNRGLARFRNGQVTPVAALDDHAVTAIASTADSHLWVGTNGAGLFYFDGSSWGPPPGAVPPPSPAITAILVDTEQTVWVGARSGGVIRFKP